MSSVTQSLKAFLSAPGARALGPRVLLAVSGGADSVALLRAAAALGPSWDFAVLHCEHGLRGRASAGDAIFVAKLCARLGLPCRIERTRLTKGPGLETRARAWRRSCYAKAARAHKARLVLLAQHQDDQAETLLLNLLRGAGLRGAGAMAPLAPLSSASRVQLGRPFLSLPASALRAWLRRLRQPWREDASNRRADNPRNLLRLRVLPLLRQLRPDASARLAAFAALARQDEQRLREKVAPNNDPRALRAWVERLRPKPAFNQRLATRLQALQKKGHGSVTLGAGWMASCSAGRLKARRQGSIIQAKAPAASPLREGKPLRWGAWQLRASLLARPKSLSAGQRYYFDPSAVRAGLRLAAPGPGARIQPYGMQGTRKVVDLLRDAGVPAWERSRWPLLTNRSGKVLAVLGVRQGQDFAVAGNCARVLCVSWKKA